MATPQNTIVVGVDGSPSSRSALSWALGQASLTGTSVTAVIAWEFPAFYSWEGGTMPPEEFEDAAHENLHRAVDETVTDAHRHVPVHREVRHGHAAQVMLEASKGAELLVLGSRGHGGFVGALLGSVSHKCVHHAGCPVVILRN